MLFSSISFLYVFLPLVLVLYHISPARLKNYVLLIASLIFYFFGEPVYVVLLVISSLSDWLHSLYIESHRGTKKAKAALVSSVVVNLAMLGFFKYADFFIGSINGLLGTAIPETGVALPIGISFFTFQTMSYTIDVYRGRVRAQKNLATLTTFVCLFPQLIAGPIVRYSDVETELTARRHGSVEDVAAGVRRFVFGLAKKVLIADAMGQLCEIFRQSGDKSILFFWIYALAFTLQIYFDFSGYSDMAIGLGKMFGFSFPENFDYPYMSSSITEFWRRWHMTLGSFFRDYVYIPMGGNRVSTAKWIRNIAVVWALTGLWHGAAWNFVLWGVFFGIMLIVERLWLGGLLERAAGAIRHVYVMLIVVVSFVLFNGDGISGAASDLAGMFGLGGMPASSGEALYYLKSYAVLLCVAVVGATPLFKNLWLKVKDRRAMAILEPVAVAALLIASTAYIIDGSFSPFLYFRF